MCALSLLTGCGSDHPTSPPAPLAPQRSIDFIVSSPGVFILVPLPESGTTISLVQNYSVIWDQELKNTMLFVQMFDARGRECVTAWIPQSPLHAERRTTYATNELTNECGQHRFQTVRLRATLYPGLSTSRPEQRSDALITRAFDTAYDFVPPEMPHPEPSSPPPGPSFSVSVSGGGSCFAPCSLTFVAHATNGTPPYGFSWSGCTSGTGASATCFLATKGTLTGSVSAHDAAGHHASASTTGTGK